MADSLYLAWQYLRQNKGTTLTLVASLTLIMFLPASLLVVVDQGAEHFRSRAESTPLLVGSRGSALELVLGTLYFEKAQPEDMRFEQLQRIEQLGLGHAIPIHASVRSKDTPIVGTTTDYLRMRRLAVRTGRYHEVLGECVIGAAAAERLQLGVGGKFPVIRQKAFALTEAPLRLHVVGVLKPTETPDDEAIFVDLKSVWIIEGYGHGHQAGAKHGTAEAAEFTDITPANISEVHFHGDVSRFPLTAVIVQPDDKKAQAMLLGEYLSPEDPAQIVRPDLVMDSLLAKILMVRSYVIAVVGLVSLVTLAVIALVITLSVRLRSGEITTMTKMGCSRFAMVTIIGSQVAIILIASALLATGLTLVAGAYGEQFVRAAAF